MKIDIVDINYHHSHESLNLPFEKDTRLDNYTIFLKKWISVTIQGIAGLLFFFKDKKDFSKASFLLLGFTPNNLRSLQPLCKLLPDALLYTRTDMPLQKIRRYSLLYSPCIILKIFKSKGYLKKSYLRRFTYFCQTYAYYHVAIYILKKVTPDILIVANDHSYPQRAFFRAAQNLKIKTVYVQHASVTENFPPLEYDYAFLDGRESFNKYIANNKKCFSKVFLAGSPRFDFINNLPKPTDEFIGINCGIAININDQKDKIENLIRQIKASGKQVKVTLRPHPLMDKEEWYTFAIQNQCGYSCSRTENPFEFIHKNHFLISGESSFHLDVVLCRKASFYYNFSYNEPLDWYGYLQEKLIEDISYLNEEELSCLLDKEHTINTEKIKYYVSNFDTKYWGKSSALIVDTLLSLNSNQALKQWQRTDYNLYTLKNI